MIENQDELMVQAARMYYFEDMTQAEIAKKLYVSRTKVSRLLKEARDTKKVEIQISQRVQKNRFLEKQLKKSFLLDQAVVLSNLPEEKEKALGAIAQETADYMESVLKKNSVVGITRGHTMQAVVDCMAPQKQLPIKVVQLIGLMNNPSQNEEEMELVRKFAKAYGGTYHNLFTPFVLTDEEARVILNRVAAVGKTLELARSSNIILTSLGRVDLADSHILWNSYLTEDEKNRLLEKQAVGLYCGHYYDIQGRLIDTKLDSKIFGLKAEEIAAKPQVIGVALGKEKVLPILGALRGRLVKTLITDEQTALNVLIADGKQIL